MKRSDEVELQQLKSRDPRSWSVADVAKFLDILGLGEYKITFIENDVAGAELVELTDSEAQSMGLRKLGRRKQLLAAVKDLVHRGCADVDSSSDSMSDHHSDAGSTSPAMSGPVTKFKAKAKWDGKWIVLPIDKSTKLKDLRKKLRQETRCKVNLSYTDSDGDIVEIRRSAHLTAALEASKDGVLRLKLAAEDTKSSSTSSNGIGGIASSSSSALATSTTAVGATESAIFDTIRDGVIAIDEFGKMIYCNSKIGTMFGASATQLIGQNVKVLMSGKDAESHDFYLWRYNSSRDAHIVGKSGRLVVARRFDGTSLTVTLTVAEGRATNGKPIFIGTLSPVQREESSNRFGLMDAMLQPVIAIDVKGAVLYLNKKFTQISGYEATSLLGRNIKVIMPSPFSENHDSYLKRYLETGDSKIIGVGRDVVMLKKDQSVLPVNLNINVSGSGADVAYIGVISVLEDTDRTVDNLLSAQRQVLDSLPVAAVLINQKGVVQVFNGAAQKLFGYSATETLGRNVNMLMPDPEKGKHDGYLRTYLKQGRRENSTVIGSGRDVIGQKKSGEMIPLHLSVTEHIDSTGSRFFSGILQS